MSLLQKDPYSCRAAFGLLQSHNVYLSEPPITLARRGSGLLFFAWLHNRSINVLFRQAALPLDCTRMYASVSEAAGHIR